MLRVLGKSGIDKNLLAKIHHACEITISETDCLPLVCRKCEAFVFKVSDFKQKSHNIQVELELQQKFSVKRCTELSPSCKQPAATEIHGKTSAKQLFFEEKPAQKNGGDHEEPLPTSKGKALGTRLRFLSFLHGRRLFPSKTATTPSEFLFCSPNLLQ